MNGDSSHCGGFTVNIYKKKGQKLIASRIYCTYLWEK